MKSIVLLLITLYRNIVSPFFVSIFGKGSMCRFEPTCSVYMEQAVRKHGAIKGVKMGVKRLVKCHPFGGHGYDPVR